VLDRLGGLYLTGEFYREATFGDFTLSSGSYYRAGFLAKADLNGVFLWAQTLGTGAHGVALDSADNVFVTGEFMGTASFGGVFLATREVNGNGAYLASFAPSGAVLWARNSEQSPSYYGNPLTVDSADRVYLAGGFYSEATFGGTTFSKPSSSSTVLSKLDADGQTLWHKQITGTGDNYPRVLARDTAGNVYLTGYFRNQVVFGETNLSSSISETYSWSKSRAPRPRRSHSSRKRKP